MKARASKRTEEPQVRKAQILQAARQCFRKAGFHATTMAEIATTARVSVGLIYRFFPTKESLIEGIVREDADQQLAHLRKLLKEGLADVVTTAMKSRVFVDRLFDRKRTALMLEIAAEAMRNRKVRAIFETNQKRFREILSERWASQRPVGLSADEVQARLDLVNAMLSGVSIHFAFQSRTPDPVFLGLLTQITKPLFEATRSQPV